MNTTLLIQQLTVAILASAIVIPAVQKIKGWLPDAKFVEPVSVALAFLIGMGVAFYYASYSILDSAIVGFFSVVGAEGIYQLLGDKLKSYSEKSAPVGVTLDEPVEEGMFDGKVG